MTPLGLGQDPWSVEGGRGSDRRLLSFRLPSLFAPRFPLYELGRERCAALAAESKPRWILKATLRAAGTERAGALAAELHPFWIFKPTAWATHSPDPLWLRMGVLSLAS